MRFFERPKNNTNTPQSLSFWETFKEWVGNASGLPGNAKLESLDSPTIFAKKPLGISQQTLHAQKFRGLGMCELGCCDFIETHVEGGLAFLNV